METVMIDRAYYRQLLRRAELIHSKSVTPDTITLPRELANDLFHDSRAYHYLKLSLLREGFDLEHIDGLGRPFFKRIVRPEEQIDECNDATHMSNTSLEAIEEVQEEGDQGAYHVEDPLPSYLSRASHIGCFTLSFDTEHTALIQPLSPSYSDASTEKPVERNSENGSGDVEGKTKIMELDDSSVYGGDVRQECTNTKMDHESSLHDEIPPVKGTLAKLDETSWDIIERPLTKELDLITRIKQLLAQAEETRRSAEVWARSGPDIPGSTKADYTDRHCTKS